MAQSGPGPAYSNYAAAAAPAAGAAIVSLAVPAGTYEVAIEAYYTGTVAAADNDNIELQSDPVTAATFVNQGIYLLPGLAAAANAVAPTRRIIVTAQSTIKVIAVGAATASSVYHVAVRALEVATLSGYQLADEGGL